MRIRILLPALALLSASPLWGQTPGMQPPSPQQLQQMRQVAETMMNPAAMVLARRADLGLTPAQVSSIEPLVERMRGSVAEMLEQAPSPAQTRLMQSMSDPTVEVDEAALHAEICERAKRQATFMIAAARTQQALHGILTGEQREKLQAMQVNMGMQMMQGVQGGMGGAPR